MPNLTRREFLRRLAAASLGTLATSSFLSACEKEESPLSATRLSSSNLVIPTTAAHTPSIVSTTSATAAPTISHAATQLPAAYPHLVVARGGQPEELVRRALAALGGMEQFVRQGDDVIIKPNICVGYHSFEYAATTNPWVVGELVRLCLAAGARRVRVMDQPFGSGPEQAYANSGIQKEVQAAGGQMEIMSGFKFVPTDMPQGVDLKKWELYADALKADVLIDVPIAKHHNLARLTLGMKNLMGLIRNRSSMHSNLGQRLADLASVFQPTLTVVDAVRILMANGPTGGNLADVKKLDTVIVSPDIVAADSYAATLFSLQPDDLAYVRAAAAMGLGRSDLQNLNVEEVVFDG